MDIPEDLGARLADSLLQEAIRRRATDIHVEPHAEGAKVRYRIDGTLYDGEPISRQNRFAVMARLKQLAGMDTTTRRICQEGRLSYSFEDSEYYLTMNVVPYVDGEKIVAKVLRAAGTVGLTQIADPADQAKLEALISRTHGLVLVTGLVDSGRTSTLMSLAARLAERGLNVASVEEAALLRIPGVRQAEVNMEVGLTFPILFRAVLRQDVDAMLVGEMRDREAALLTAEAALQGRLVLAGLHTDDAPSAVSRLLDLGMPAFMAATALLGVCSQRLVRTICPGCKEQTVPEAETLSALGLDPAGGTPFYHGRGCEQCAGGGYLGRVAIHEILENSEEMHHLIITRATSHALRQKAIEQGMVTFTTAAARLAVAGRISADEAARAASQVRALLPKDATRSPKPAGS